MMILMAETVVGITSSFRDGLLFLWYALTFVEVVNYVLMMITFQAAAVANDLLYDHLQNWEEHLWRMSKNVLITGSIAI